MLRDVASLVVDFLGANDLKQLKQVEKHILDGPVGKYTLAKVNNQITQPSSLSVFLDYILFRNPNLFKLEQSVAYLRDVTHLHLVFEYPHVVDTSQNFIDLQRYCPLLRFLTIEGPLRFIDQVMTSLTPNTLQFRYIVTPECSIENYSQPNYHEDFIVTHNNVH